MLQNVMLRDVVTVFWQEPSLCGQVWEGFGTETELIRCSVIFFVATEVSEWGKTAYHSRGDFDQETEKPRACYGVPL